MLTRRIPAAAMCLVALTGICTAGLATAPRPAQADAIRDAQQWVLDMLNAPSAWATSKGQGVTVAVLDSGVSPAVTDLTGSVITGPDLTGVHTSGDNPNWGTHGTWMASLISGHGNNGGADGIMGIAPRSKVLSIRVIPDHGDPGYNSYQREPESRIQQSLATGIRDAVRYGAAIISMSIGYGEPSKAVRSALQYAYDRGVVVVASSGNGGDSSFARDHAYAPFSFPADYPGVLGVAAVGADGAAAAFSSDNLSVQVAAPGVKVPAQGRDGQYWLVSGTSPACALVAGAAALLKSAYPRLSPALVIQAMTATTRSRPARGGYDDHVGFGTVDVAAALAAAGTLVGYRSRATGVAAASQFGGGGAAVPPAPVRPRGTGQLVLFAFLALASVVLTAAAARRIAVRGRPRQQPAGPYPHAGPGPPPTAAYREGSSAGRTSWGDDPPGPFREDMPWGTPPDPYGPRPSAGQVPHTFSGGPSGLPGESPQVSPGSSWWESLD